MSYYPFDWFWTVDDTNPASAVYSSKTGNFVANDDASFLAFLDFIEENESNNFQSVAVSGAVTAAGLIKLTVPSSAGLRTGQYVKVTGVEGTTEANDSWRITVVDGTHIILQASTFTHAYTSGGHVLYAPGHDTFAELLTAIYPESEYPYNWFWMVGDQDYGESVFSSAIGGFVTSSSDVYQAFLSAGNYTTRVVVLNATEADDGSGNIRLHVSSTQLMATGQYWNVNSVGGTTEANGNWPITVLDAHNIILEGSTFVHAHTGEGYVQAGATTDSFATLSAELDDFNRTLYSETGATVLDSQYDANANIDLPIAYWWNIVNGAGAALFLTVPPVCTPGFLPLGQTIIVHSDPSSNDTITIQGVDGGVILELEPNETYLLTFFDNNVVGHDNDIGVWRALNFQPVINVGEDAEVNALARWDGTQWHGTGFSFLPNNDIKKGDILYGSDDDEISRLDGNFDDEVIQVLTSTGDGEGGAQIPAWQGIVGLVSEAIDFLWGFDDAWTAYTPVVTAGDGSITTKSATGRWKQFGKIVFFRLDVEITTNGTGDDYVIATLPTSAHASGSAAAGFDATSHVSLVGVIGGSAVDIYAADGTYPGGDGVTLTVSGSYEFSE